MIYRVKTEKSAKRSLAKIPKSYAVKIKARIDQLANNPFPPGCKKLKKIEDEPQYSIRIGQYRVVYEVNEDKILILVVKIGHRKDIYR